MLNIAFNTFKEIVRNKFLYLIIFFALVLIVFSLALGKLTIWESQKVILDFWIAMIEIFWLIWVLFVWSQLLFKEIDGKTIFLILSKPIKRYEFILWKFLWFSFIILLITFIQSILYLFVLYFNSIQIDFLLIMSIVFIFLKLLITLAIVMFLSTFMSNILTIITTIFIYFISHSFSLLIDMATKSKDQIFIYFTKIVQLLFPPFEAMNLKDYIWSVISFNYIYFLSNIAYSIIYLFLILIITILIFNRKKFEN